MKKKIIINKMQTAVMAIKMAIKRIMMLENKVRLLDVSYVPRYIFRSDCYE